MSSISTIHLQPNIILNKFDEEKVDEDEQLYSLVKKIKNISNKQKYIETANIIIVMTIGSTSMMN